LGKIALKDIENDEQLSWDDVTSTI
jgi:sialic acid synthase SpsE